MLSVIGLFSDGRIEKRRRRHATESAARPTIPDRVSLLCRAVLAFGSAALLSLMALWFFHRIYRGGEGARGVVPWQLLVLCTLVVIGGSGPQPDLPPSLMPATK